MALPDPQKAFYDTRRYFQGKDNPDVPEPPPPSPEAAAVPRSQLLIGVAFLLLVVGMFFFFGRPQPIDTSAGAPSRAPVAAPAPPAAH